MVEKYENGPEVSHCTFIDGENTQWAGSEMLMAGPDTKMCISVAHLINSEDEH